MNRKADVVIPVYRDVAVTRDCIQSVLELSGTALGRLIVVNDASPDRQMAPMLKELAATRPDIVVIENEANVGFVSSCNRGMALRSSDVVLLNSDARVTNGWLAEMLAVLDADDRIACVVPLSNNATIFSVPDFDRATSDEAHPRRNLDLSEMSPRMTRVPTAVGFCLLMRGAVLNRMGGFDPAYGRGYNEENDWVMRAKGLGFIAVRANRAFVYHVGAVSFGAEERERLDRANAALLVSRYPHFFDEVDHFRGTLDSRLAAHAVRRRLGGATTVCLDLRGVTLSDDSGTVLPTDDVSIYACEIAKRLVELDGLEVVSLALGDDQKKFVARMGIRPWDPSRHPEVQVVHRPSPVLRADDLRTLLEIPAHLVVNAIDPVAFRKPDVSESFAELEQRRAIAYASLNAAQAVIAFSDRCKWEMVRDFQLAPERVRTIYPGVNEAWFAKRDETRNRAHLEGMGIRRPFFVAAGSDLPPEDLRFLLAGYAVFRARLGGGESAPMLLVVSRAAPREDVTDILVTSGWPSGVARLFWRDRETYRAIVQESLAFLHPSAFDGCSLPALEALASGTPILASPFTTLSEIARDAAVYLDRFSVDEIATHLLDFAKSPERRRTLGRAGRARASEFTWQAAARRTADLYREAIDAPVESTLVARRMLATLVRSCGLRKPE